MNRIVSKILMYGDMPEDSILMELSGICAALRAGSRTKEELSVQVFRQVKRLLVLATDYGFDKNLWHNYLAFWLIMMKIRSALRVRRQGRMREAPIILPKVILKLLWSCLPMISAG